VPYVCQSCASDLVGLVLKFARFIWKPRKADEAEDHIATYNYDKSDSRKGDVSMLEALLSSFCVEEDPHMEYPFHGLVNEAKVSSELHNGQVYISIRSPARDRIEELSERQTMENMPNISHFAFVVDADGPENSPALSSLGLAADTLGDWFKETVGQAKDFAAKE
jgi:hypothetical protein